jgi:hypothetical protein
MRSEQGESFPVRFLSRQIRPYRSDGYGNHAIFEPRRQSTQNDASLPLPLAGFRGDVGHYLLPADLSGYYLIH